MTEFDETAIAEAPPPVYAAPPGTRMPLPSIEEQTRRWETPYDRQLANDLASEQAGLQQAQAEAAKAAAANAQLARSRDAVKMATEFVRRKEAERMVREGVSLEEAEFKSRIKYNTATASQLNAMRPVQAPQPSSMNGVQGVRFGRYGEQWKPLPTDKESTKILNVPPGAKVFQPGTGKVLYENPSAATAKLGLQDVTETIPAEAGQEAQPAKPGTKIPLLGTFGAQPAVPAIAKHGEIKIKRTLAADESPLPDREGGPSPNKQFDSVADAKKDGARPGDVIMLWNAHKNKYSKFRID